MISSRYLLPRLLLDSSTNVETISKNMTANTNTDDTDFDGNKVIILAALLCAIICALGLNSIIRCALRYSRRFAHDSDEAAAAAFAPTGLKKEALSRIPVVVYKSGLHIPATDCPICLGEFVEGENVRILPRCNHGFHVKCIDRWLVLHSSCPICRQLPLVGNCASVNAELVRVQIH